MKSFPISQLREIITEHYRIGKLVDYEKLLLGYENTTYAIETVLNGERHKYCFRRYKPERQEADLQFEHSVINHLIARDFNLAARIIDTTDGRSYLKRLEGEKDALYAIFTFLPGEDEYAWDTPPTSLEVFSNAAAVLAQFHNAVSDLNPEGHRQEPEIIEFLPSIARSINERAEAAGKTQLDTCLRDNLSFYNETIDRILETIDVTKYKELPHQIIHCDYHPSNLKYQNKKITGLFDYDWTRIEARCFDVALAVMHFSILWGENQDGHFGLDKVAAFLDSYQKTLEGSNGAGPLNDIELRYLPHLVRTAVVYMVYWFIEDFYVFNADPAEYFRFLEHYTRILRWLDNSDNWDTLKNICAESAIP